MTLGSKLQLLRKQQGMSQEILAQELQISRQTVSKWELDTSQPDLSKVVQISKIFGVSCDYLLIDEIEQPDFCNAKQTPIHTSKHKNLTKTILSWIMIALGTSGHLGVLVMSSVIEVLVPLKTRRPDGTIWYTYSSDHYGHDYSIFVSEHNLEILLVILTIFLMCGIVLLLDGKFDNKIFYKIKSFVKGFIKKLKK